MAQQTIFRTAIGQDSHRFLHTESSKPCVIAGHVFEEVPGFKANSDGDVVYHAICNAISSISHELILGGVADDLYHKDGIIDSLVYLHAALGTLKGKEIVHVSIALEAKKPSFKPYLLIMRQNIAKALGIDIASVGITATSGEGLTEFGCGEGVQCLCILTIKEVINVP